VLGIEIGSIGFDAGVGGHAILFGGEGMHDACFKSGFGESPFGSQMVVTGSFHDDDHVLNVILFLSFADLRNGQLEEGRLMLQRLTLDEHVPIVVGHHPLRSMFGWVDADDGELLPAHSLNAGPDDATGFLQTLSIALLRLRIRLTTIAAVCAGFAGHSDSPYWEKWEALTFSPTAIQAAALFSEEIFSGSRASYLCATQSSSAGAE
jgi:hypothetical protein